MFGDGLGCPGGAEHARGSAPSRSVAGRGAAAVWQATSGVLRTLLCSARPREKEEAVTSMHHYWLSTPSWTCWVQVDPRASVDGTIVACAPFLWRRWRGKSWTALRATTRRQYGTHAVRVMRLPDCANDGMV